MPTIRRHQIELRSKQLAAKLIEIGREIGELQDEQARLNKHAPGAEGTRHVFISAQIRILRDTERDLHAQQGHAR